MYNKMESLPDDILERLIIMQTDARTTSSLACVNRLFRDLTGNVIRKISLPNQTSTKAVCTENFQYLTKECNKKENLCTVCWFCTAIIPVHLEAILVTHRCSEKTYEFVMATNRHNVLWNHTTQHLTQPSPCDNLTLCMQNVPRPKCAPYVESPPHSDSYSTGG